MNVRTILTATLAVLALVLAVIQVVHPFSGSPISPIIPITVVLLIGVRYAAVRRTKQREQLLKEVPKRPLGITDPGDGTR